MKTDICTSSFLWISSFYFLQIVIHFLIIEEHYLMPKNRIAFEKNVVTTSPVQIIAVNPVTAWVFICRFSYLIWNIYFTLFQFQKPAFLATKKTLSSKIILLIMKFHPFHQQNHPLKSPRAPGANLIMTLHPRTLTLNQQHSAACVCRDVPSLTW